VFDDASSSTLSSRLDELVDAGYLDRERYAESPRVSSTPTTATNAAVDSSRSSSGPPAGNDKLRYSSH